MSDLKEALQVACTDKSTVDLPLPGQSCSAEAVTEHDASGKTGVATPAYARGTVHPDPLGVATSDADNQHGKSPQFTNSLNGKEYTMNEQKALIEGFDLNALRLPQNFGEALGVKRLITRVPVRKPNKTEFFRVRTGPDWRFQTMILELKEESETFLLAPELWDVVPELLRPAMLHTAVDRRNNVFLIPVPLPGPDGRRNSWHQSLAEVVERAETMWVRCVANKAVSGYDMLVAEGSLPEPEWPELGFEELVEIAFRDRLIRSAEHPVVQQLLGRS